jgi:hypothetical protein
MYMKFVRCKQGFLGQEGRKRRPAQSSRKEREWSTLAAAEEEVPSAKVDKPAFLPRDPQAMLPCFSAAEAKI